jgi:hypothetical protein
MRQKREGEALAPFPAFEVGLGAGPALKRSAGYCCRKLATYSARACSQDA